MGVPGEAFLASMEEDLMKLIIKQGQTVSRAYYMLFILIKVRDLFDNVKL